jgi:hypothetical protein
MGAAKNDETAKAIKCPQQQYLCIENPVIQLKTQTKLSSINQL